MELKKIKLLIAESESEKAIVLLLEKEIEPGFFNRLILQSNQLAEAKRLLQSGLIKLEDYNLVMARINVALLEVIDAIENNSNGNPKPFVADNSIFSSSNQHVRKTLPIYSFGTISDDRLRLSRIELMDNKLILHLSYKVSAAPPNNGPYINRSTYIQVKGIQAKFYLDAAFNIPYEPHRDHFQLGDEVVFQLIFPKPDQAFETFDLIEEDILDGTVFSIKDIKVQL